MEPPPPLPLPPPPLPREPLLVDLQLEIVAHSDDAATIVRCAAASKALRGAVRGPGFRPRHRAALRAAARAGFDPALLLGVTHASSDRVAVDPLASRPLRLDARLLRSFEFEPVSSSDGLVVLWRQEPEPELRLRVCNTSTGRATTLPCMDVEGKWGNGGIYRPALLNVGRHGHSFELFVMDVCFRTRIFSTKSGDWGSIRIIKPPPDPEYDSWCVVDQAMRTSPAVVRRTIHWICRSTRSGGVFILALQVGAAQATAIAPPKGCTDGSIADSTLTATSGMKLRIIVPEKEVISTWTLMAEGWSREVVISRQVMPPAMDANRTAVCWCVGFQEKSGNVLFWMERVGLVHLNLGTKKAIVLRGCRGHDTSAVTPVPLQEIDLASLL